MDDAQLHEYLKISGFPGRETAFFAGISEFCNTMKSFRGIPVNILGNLSISSQTNEIFTKGFPMLPMGWGWGIFSGIAQSKSGS